MLGPGQHTRAQKLGQLSPAVDAAHEREAHLCHKCTRDKDEDFPVCKELKHSSSLCHDSCFLEDGNVGSIISNHAFRINDQPGSQYYRQAHDNNEDHIYSIRDTGSRFFVVDTEGDERSHGSPERSQGPLPCDKLLLLLAEVRRGTEMSSYLCLFLLFSVCKLNKTGSCPKTPSAASHNHARWKRTSQHPKRRQRIEVQSIPKYGNQACPCLSKYHRPPTYMGYPTAPIILRRM